MNGDPKADSSGHSEAWKHALRHDSSQKEVEAWAEQEATDRTKADSSFHIPVLSEHAEILVLIQSF